MPPLFLEVVWASIWLPLQPAKNTDGGLCEGFKFGCVEWCMGPECTFWVPGEQYSRILKDDASKPHKNLKEVFKCIISSRSTSCFSYSFCSSSTQGNIASTRICGAGYLTEIIFSIWGIIQKETKHLKFHVEEHVILVYLCWTLMKLTSLSLEGLCYKPQKKVLQFPRALTSRCVAPWFPALSAI